MYANRIETLTWIVVLLGSALAWLVATLAIAGSTAWPMAVVIPLTLVFGLLVGAVSRAISSGPTRGRSGIAGRAAVGVAVGIVVGELGAVVLFSGTTDRRLDEQASARADAAPAVAQASADLQRTRDVRAGLDDAVGRALERRDEALVVARCEFNPAPACPQTRITGLPGAGPENRTANDFLTDTARQLDIATAERERRAPELDAQIAADEQALAQARSAAAADADHGLGARWAAMNDHTVAGPAAMLLRVLTIAFFVLVYLLPLILNSWRGETTDDRGAAGRAERERAEIEADTAIAVKRAEVRAAVETMWAEQQLASARMAVEAQTEIDREQQRRRVTEAIEGPVQVQAERVDEPVAALPAGPTNLPARVEAGDVEQRREGGLLPDVTKVAGRWIRPFVPPIVASVVETATKPLRGARQTFEEEEELHFSMKRTRKVTVETEEHGEVPTSATRRPTVASQRREPIDARVEHASLGPAEAPSLTRGEKEQRQLPTAE